MTISNMAFAPTGGLNDATYSPTNPTNEASIRSQIQGVSDQLRDYINNTLNPYNASTYETIADLTTNRKLSPTGDFTGTLNGFPIAATDPGIISIVNTHLASRKYRTLNSLSDIGISDASLSNTNFETNISTIMTAMGINAELTLWVNTVLNANLALSITTYLQSINLYASTSDNAYMLTLKANNAGVTAPNEIWIIPNNKNYLYHGTFDNVLINVVDLTNSTRQNKLLSQNVLYDVTSISSIESTINNMFSNPCFYVWHNGNTATIPYHVDDNGGIMACGNWCIKTITASMTATKLNSINGGMNINMTFDSALLSFVYLRQGIPVVDSMSNKTYTMCADVEVDTTVDVDWYVNVRFDAVDANRINVCDTPNLTLSPGRHKVACTFTVPDITSHLSTVTDMNGLETAFRFNGINKTVNAKVYNMVITEGDVVKSNPIINTAKDTLEVEHWYEKGTSYFAGFTTTSWQKGGYLSFKTHKYRTPTITVSDAVGNVGKVSLYDTTGVRTDNVTPSFISATQDGMTLVMNTSTTASIYFNYIANCYYV